MQKWELGKQPITEVAVKILTVYFLKITMIFISHWERRADILFTATELKLRAQTLSSPLKPSSTLQTEPLVVKNHKM